jgi:hypothetical protein
MKLFPMNIIKITNHYGRREFKKKEEGAKRKEQRG